MNLQSRYEIDLSRLRIPGAALVAGGLLFAHLPSAWGVPCPMRAMTGVPCPFCGLTTSVRDSFGGHLGAAVAAAPLGLLVIAFAVAGLFRWGPRRLYVPVVVLTAVLLAEWVFELHRFHVIA